jgi:arylsulfatase A-like enzyme
MSCYGYKKDTSPNLDEFAKQSVFFVNAYSTSAWTFPSHFSIFTSRFPNRTDLLMFKAVKSFDDSYVTLAEILSSAGYQTAAFTGGGWVAGELGFGQGFDSYVTHGRRFEHNQEALFTWIADHGSERKFFLFLHGFNTHRPYNAPKHLKTKFIKAKGIPKECRGITFASEQPGREECFKAKGGIRYMRSQYDAEIFYVDVLMKRLFDELKKHGLFENSIIIITSDHGEELFDHGRYDHIRTLYEELIRVPLIVRMPGGKAREVRGKVSNLDLMPTLLDMLDIPYEKADLHGQSIPALLGGQERDSDIYALTGMTGEPALPVEGMPFIILSVISNTSKLINKIRQDKSEAYELYDLKKDPLEKENLIETRGDATSVEHAATVDSLKQLVQDWARRMDVRLDLYEVEETEEELSPETLKQLKALGYLN